MDNVVPAPCAQRLPPGVRYAARPLTPRTLAPARGEKIAFVFPILILPHTGDLQWTV